MSTLRFLNSTETANHFMTLAATATGAKALLGDADKFEDTEASAAILNANAALTDGVATVERLARDETRTPPQRNAAAAQVADRVIAQLEKSKTAIESRINSLHASGIEEARDTFAPNLNRAFLDAQIIDYIKTNAGKADGIVKIHELVRTNKNVAAVVFNTESFLLNINDKTHQDMALDAVKHHAPNAFAKLGRSAAMVELPSKYATAAASVKRSFFNPAEKAKMGSRVEV